MKLVLVIPLDKVVNLNIKEPGYTLVISQGFLKVYKQVKR
jgi:hypothetical protein